MKPRVRSVLHDKEEGNGEKVKCNGRDGEKKTSVEKEVLPNEMLRKTEKTFRGSYDRDERTEGRKATKVLSLSTKREGFFGRQVWNCHCSLLLIGESGAESATGKARGEKAYSAQVGGSD